MDSGANLYLTGFMGSGKSTVGRLVAERLGRPFVDLDLEIEARAGRPVERIFQEEGEEGFRRLEQQALREVASRPAQVVATGGGIVERPEGRELLARSGEVVWLFCPVEQAVSRALNGGPVRPLLAGDEGSPLDRARALWNRRQWLYACAPIWVDARPEAASQVADRVLEALEWYRIAPTAAWVLGPGHAYPLVVGRNLIERLGAMVEHLARRRGLGGSALVIADRGVQAVAERIGGTLSASGWRVGYAPVGPGEAAKSLETLASAWEQAKAAGLDRSGLVIGVGGGAALDLAGFTAATYMRGVAWISVPTTLLAQVDAAIGGKTAVNIPSAKNLVGAFHHPLAVVADVDVLSTLPRREVAAGMAEVVKHALVGDPSLLELVDGTGEALPDVVLVARAAKVKALVVSEDPNETGRRAVLNFGHTVGHALEVAGNFERYLHGEAVAIGMVTATMLSERVGVLQEPGLVERLIQLLRRIGLPSAAGPEAPDADLLWNLMDADKKKQAGLRRWVLLERPGEPVVASGTVTPERFARVWQEQNGAGPA